MHDLDCAAICIKDMRIWNWILFICFFICTSYTFVFNFQTMYFVKVTLCFKSILYECTVPINWFCNLYAKRAFV